MECVTTANFVILVNGVPFSSFKASRRLRQGCPLYPLLSLLVVEGLSLLIKEEKRMGNIKGIHITSTLDLTHIHFLDDVVLFGNGTLRNGEILSELLIFSPLLQVW